MSTEESKFLEAVMVCTTMYLTRAECEEVIANFRLGCSIDLAAANVKAIRESRCRRVAMRLSVGRPRF